jgi:2,3-bisphosphoglycerate-independent phosphoglycerate mutase
MKPVLMIFLDGVGIGRKDFEFNPFFKYGFETFDKIFGDIPHLDKSSLQGNNCFLFPSDAQMGVDGLPQSGTGQVSIFCGVNAPKFVGKHFGPFPYSTTIPIIAEKNIFKIFKDKGENVFFANAYPKIFFDYLKSGKTRLSVTTLSCKLTGIRLNKSKDVRKGKALTAEITNERWNKKLNYNIKEISPETGAKKLLRIASKNDFTLYEFFLTDHLGHGRITEEFNRIYSNIDKFLLTLLQNLNHNEMTLIICSDHGNLEDLSIKTHTKNPALTITAGLNAEELSKNINDLSDIKPSIIKYCS